MALSRCIETRLLEAVWRETKACFAQADLGLADLYANQIHARPWQEGEALNPYTIFITPVPAKWEQGVGGVSDNFYIIEVTFVFPWSAANFAAGGNTFIDHIQELRAYLTGSGSLSTRTGAIADPDNLTQEVAHIASFAWTEPSPAPGNAGMAVPVLLEYETRENKLGVVT